MWGRTGGDGFAERDCRARVS
uniref:Uncharacterized protein n=1 Tax=Arundo donax TaxID=35708 RepID=A0A0A9H622_ARUDO